MKDTIIYRKIEDFGIADGFNVRYDYGDLAALALSISSNGIKIPLRGYLTGGKYIITDGHRRYKAIQSLDNYSDLIPIIVEPNNYGEDNRTLDLIVSNDGKRLTLLEESDVYARLVKYGWGVSKIAKSTGKSIPHISNCLSLVGISGALRKNIRDEKISASAVIELLKKESERAVNNKVSKALNKNKGNRITTKHLKKLTKKHDSIVKPVEKITNDHGFTLKYLEILRADWGVIIHDNGGNVQVYNGALAVLDKMIAHLAGNLSKEDFSSDFFTLK